MQEKNDTTFEEINQLIQNYLKARNWQDNTSRSLAISIALEANELLEHYQWEENPVGSKEDIAEELADIFIYAFQFADINNVDIASAIKDKLRKAEKKYPVEKFQKGTAEERNKAWVEAKLDHKKKGL